MAFAQSMEKAFDTDPLLFSFGALFLPAILAFIFYRLSLRIAMHGSPKGQGQTSEVADANLTETR